MRSEKYFGTAQVELFSNPDNILLRLGIFIAWNFTFRKYVLSIVLCQKQFRCLHTRDPEESVNQTLFEWFWFVFLCLLKINLCQKHQLTHNMMTDCWLNYKFNTWKFQAQTLGDHVVYRNCFWHSDQFLYTTCSAKRRASDKDLPVCSQFTKGCQLDNTGT